MVDSSGNFSDTGMIELSGKVMVVAIILFLLVLSFVFCLHLYAKFFWYEWFRQQENPTTTTRRRRRLDFSGGHQEITITSPLSGGLDPILLKEIPIVVFDPKEFKDELECAVCLCEVSEGENTRFLPKCNHGFHVDCIDMWFQSHSTCPLCRNTVENPCDESTNLENIPQIPLGEITGFSTEVRNFPTNVLFWGDETRVTTFGNGLLPTYCVDEDHRNNVITEPPSSSSASPSSPSSASSSSSSSSSNVCASLHRPEGLLVIDIPLEIYEDGERKSPVLTRLRSLKRLLSGNRRVNPSSPKNLDMEQGNGRQS